MAHTIEKALVVDADRQHVQYIEEVLRVFDLDVIVKTDGLEAFETARALKPKLILSEISLPNLDGLSMCRLLKGDDRYDKIKIIILTRFQLREYRNAVLEAKADDFLVKPCKSDELMAAIEIALGLPEGSKPRVFLVK